MRYVLVKFHQSFGREGCLLWGIMLLLGSIVLLIFSLVWVDWPVFILTILMVALSIMILVAGSNDYEDLESPMYYSVDQYGRKVMTNGKETVLLEEKPAERRMDLQVKTKEEAKDVLKMIEAYNAEERISKEDYDRVKGQLEAFLAKEESQEQKSEIEKTYSIDENEDDEYEEDYEDEAFIDTILDCHPDLYDRFERLKELYEDELITEKEYSKKKKQLLDEL